MRKTGPVLFLTLFLCFSVSAHAMSAKPSKNAPIDKRFDGLVTAPEFPDHLEWLNTAKPLSLEKLRGKIVLLDFWTYCCINCMHVIPDLKKLEEKYPNELVVIGVHSAKFVNEKNTESIRQAIMRYEIKHPVVNDKDMEVWQQYAVRAWPTLVLISPEGKIIGSQSGEDAFDLFDGAISQTIRHFEARGTLKRGPMKLALEEAKRDQTLLSYPGKIHADPVSKKLFISDSNHNRILITDADGNILDAIGGGTAGNKDGAFETAELNHPQGISLHEGFLYIADTENHSIRRAELAKRTVDTVLGKKFPLNSPWDVLVHEGNLYIAMAGDHQLWKADLQTWEAGPHAGSGAEARFDGVLAEAALAQPSGLSTDGKKLYFADSEVSSVRSADFDANGKVETLIGEDLFEFGDIDGGRDKARLQHALGVAYDDGVLYVADTYNSKIKTLDLAQGIITSYAGSGTHGLTDGPVKDAQFFEPGGIAVMDGKIYVADTNNHRVRVIDRKADTVSTLELKGLEKLARHEVKTFKGRIVKLDAKKIGAGKHILNLSFELPGGFEFAEQAPITIEIKAGDSIVAVLSGDSAALSKDKHSLPASIPLNAKEGRNLLILDGVFYYCRKENKVCLFEQVRFELPLNAAASGPSETRVKIEIPVKTGK